MQVFIHELKYCGEEASSKLKRIGEELQKKGADIYLITQLEEIACKILKISYTKGTLNLRGADNELTPYFISYLILEYKSGEYQKGTLYINKSKIDTNVNDYLKNLNVELADYAEIVSALKKIDTKIYLNEDDCNQAIISATNSFISEPVSIIKNFKARKNKVEVQGFLDCHRRDGAAIVTSTLNLIPRLDS